MHVLQLVTNDEAPFFQEQIRSLEARGVTCTVRSPPGAHSSTESRSVGAYARLVTETLRDTNEYDLIHANYGLTAPAALAQHHLPSVISLWGSDLLGRYGPICQFCAGHTDEVVVMTREMATVLDRPAHVIPHGIDMETFQSKSTTSARKELGWDQEKRHVLFPYSADREIKDFPKAARVVATAQSTVDTDIELHTISGVEHSRMSDYYNATDVLLLTSKREGSPNVLREALACNTPVVGTDVGDVAERLDGVSPSAVCQSETELNEAVAEILADPRSSNGRQKAFQTSTERTGERLEGVYHRALGSEKATATQLTADPTSP